MRKYFCAKTENVSQILVRRRNVTSELLGGWGLVIPYSRNVLASYLLSLKIFFQLSLIPKTASFLEIALYIGCLYPRLPETQLFSWQKLSHHRTDKKIYSSSLLID